MVDIAENSSYELQHDLLHQYGEDFPLAVEIASVRDRKKIDRLFSHYRPELVFHAAAHKHVPLMESCPEEAVKNNGDILVKSKVANAQAGGTGLQVAGIMSYVKNGKESQFINCTNNGHLTGPNGRSGGVLASIQGTEKAGNKVTISKCVNAGLIEDNYLDYDGYTNAKRIGGIIGGSEAADVTVESCVNSGNIFSHTGCRAGGFVGHFKGGIITGCSNTGIILCHITL